MPYDLGAIRLSMRIIGQSERAYQIGNRVGQLY
jgi:hypothetical protein